MSLSAPTLQTERLRLTPLLVEDAVDMVAVFADRRMFQFTGGAAPTEAELRARFERLVVGRSADGSQLWFNWVVRLITGQQEPVGAMQATVTADGVSADVAWEVGVPWQGRGIASEAATAVVEWLVGEGVRTVSAHIHPDHEASARVAVRAGLVPTQEIVDGETVWRRLAGE